MQLHALGGLTVPDSTFRREKPLLLLCYLLIEGPTPRRHLAELFWPGAARPLGSLSVALSHLRAGVPGAVRSDDAWVAAELDSDVAQFEAALARGDVEGATALYRGPFIAGAASRAWGSELEEWVYAVRERLAGLLQRGALIEAERADALGAHRDAARWVDRALAVAGLGPPEVDTLRRAHRLLPNDAPQARALRTQAQELGLAADELTAGPHPTSALAHRSGRLIGRDVELTELGALLARSEVRLVTVAGPGGIGKTRLALQAASDQRLAGRFDGGIHLVDLARATDGEGMLDAIAVAVGAADREAALDTALGGGRTLLVLDTLEHLRDGWPLLGRLLERHPSLTLLATSRERLHLPDEWVVPLTGLAVPEPTLPPAEAGYYGALRLFQERARRARPDFVLDEVALPAVVAICRLLGGSPLGIELAAGWVRALPSATLLDELRRSVDLLVDPTDGDGRRSARAVFERSWSLLDAQGRRALRRLSLFRNGFRHEAAAAVAEVSSRDLARLIDGSLLTLDGDGRYRQHVLVRDFAYERLTDNPEELRALRERHTDHHLALLARDGPELRSGRQREALDRLGAEIDDLELAWSWLLDRDDLERLGDAAPFLDFLYDVRGTPLRGFELLSETLERFEGAPLSPALIALRFACGSLAMRVDRHAVAGRLARRTLDEGSDLDAFTLGRAFQQLGNAAHHLGDLEGAVRYTEHALVLQTLPAERARTSANLAVMTQAIGDFDRAEALYREAIEGFAGTGNRAAVVHTQGNLGSLLLSRDRPHEAAETLTRAVGLADELAYRGALPLLLHNLAAAHAHLGDLDRAEREIRSSIEEARSSRQLRFVDGGHAMLSSILRRRGDLAGADAMALTALRGSWRAHDLAGVTTALLRHAEAAADRGDASAARTALQRVREHPSTLAWVRVAAEERLADLEPAGADEAGDLEGLVLRTLAKDGPSR